MGLVSVEYAHIYTNQHIGDEHKLSLEVLAGVREEIVATEKTGSLVVMVDDYSFPDPTFDYESFSAWLSDYGYKPDVLLRESQLIPLCDQVLDIIQDQKLKAQIIDYVKTKKYPCSLFISAWYLLRFGKLSSEIFPSEAVADELINILPESFKPFEDKGLEIIRSTPYADVADRIQYRFLEGRLIA